MKQQELNDLIDKVNNGSATDEELGLYNHYLNQLTSGEEGWDLQNLGAEENVKAELQNRIERIRKPAGLKKARLWPGVSTAPQVKLRSRLRPGFRIKPGMTGLIAAATVAAITLGVWLYSISGLPAVILNLFQDPNAVAMKNDIAPGKNTATLTLANGEVITLSDAKTGVIIDASKLTYSDGTAVGTSSRDLSPSLRGGTTRQSHLDSQNEHDEIASIPRNDGKGRPLSVSTPRGGQYQVVLPDGTRVWLNADSKLSFPSQFFGKERKVLLEGEAYFEVAKAFVTLSPSKGQTKRVRQSFIVESVGTSGGPGQQVEVLGTHFNINSYADEGSTKTTLLEGSVRVASLSSRATAKDLDPSELGMTNSITLRPSQQAILKGGALQVKEINAASAVDWKNGEFIFNDEPLESIMRKLARWYDVEVIYQGADKARLFGGGVSRYDHISSVLSKLEKTGGVHFKIEGRKVFVTK